MSTSLPIDYDKRLMLFRVVMITTLLLIAIYAEAVSETLLPVNPLYYLIAATYALTILYALALRFAPHPEAQGIRQRAEQRGIVVDEEDVAGHANSCSEGSTSASGSSDTRPAARTSTTWGRFRSREGPRAPARICRTPTGGRRRRATSPR